MNHKTFVTRRSFAFGAGQCVLFFGDRVQKDREVFAHRQKALRHHLLGRGPHHDPVAVLHRQAQESVADGTTDEVNLHAASVGSVTVLSQRTRR